MKKHCSLLLCALLFLMLSSIASAQSYTPGTYAVTTDGRNGPLTIEASFTDSAIQSVTIVSHQETAGISDAAISSIPNAIVEQQSLVVDTIAGATVTSQAIVNAVTEAVVLAGGDPDLLQKVSERNVRDETLTLDTDVVIVGAGAAGLTAAVTLADQGRDVVLVEKMSFPGGAAVTAGGGMAIAATQELKELGEHDDPAVLETYLGENGHGLNTPELSHIFAYESGPAVDYLRSLGITINYANTGRTSPYYGRHAAAGGGAGLIASLNALAQASDHITYLLSTPAKALITDEQGAVTGIRAVSSEGTTYLIQAKAVVLATGTYSANLDIVDAAYMPGTLNTAPAYLTGDGLLMAQEVGAATNHLEWVEVSPNCIATGDGQGTTIQNAAAFFGSSSAILVNQHGVRVISETSSSAEQVKAYEAQENHALYLVMDQTSFDKMRNECGTASWGHVSYTPEEVDKWLANGDALPNLVRGETLTDAAEAVGVDADALAETLSAYNSMTEAGSDTEFGRENLIGLEEGPVYILELRLGHAKTLGGLSANSDLQILGEDGSPIDNLYGAGELVSGSQGDTETGMLTWSIVSGYHIGMELSTSLQ